MVRGRGGVAVVAAKPMWDGGRGDARLEAVPERVVLRAVAVDVEPHAVADGRVALVAEVDIVAGLRRGDRCVAALLGPLALPTPLRYCVLSYVPWPPLAGCVFPKTPLLSQSLTSASVCFRSFSP